LVLYNILTTTDKEVFKEMFSAAGGRPKWKSMDKFIGAAAALLKKVTLGELVMFNGKGKEATKVDVIEVALPAKVKPGRKAGAEVDAGVDEEKAAEKEQEITSMFDASIARTPKARYFLLVNNVMVCEDNKEKVVAAAEKEVEKAQGILDRFVESNWDSLKNVIPKYTKVFDDKVAVEKARADQDDGYKAREEARKAFAQKEIESRRDA
jgi:hypothetical protein